MGGRSGGGARGTSQYALAGAAARNELRGMTANDFFHYALTHKEYQKYVKAENDRRGNPVVFGGEGAEVGHMAHFKMTVNGYKFEDTGRISSINGDKVSIDTKGGYPKTFPKSAIVAYAKDKKMDFGRFIMKIPAKQKTISIGTRN